MSFTISSMATKAKKPEPPVIDQGKQVRQWRYDRLRSLGLSATDAMALIEKPDIVHTASELIENGCPTRLIRVLLSD